MKVSRLTLFAIIAISYALATYFGGIESTNASVNSSLESILLGIAMGVFAIFSPRKETHDNPKAPVGIWRRFFAFCIDFCVALILLISVGIIPILFIEYFATGIWQWSYERENFLTRDVFSILMILSMFVGLYHYFRKHAAIGKATPGQYILGYRIIPAKIGKPRYGNRVLHSFIAFWLWPFTLIITRKVKNGIYPWDEKTNTRAVSRST